MKHIATWIRECDEDRFQQVFRSYPDVRLWNGRTESVPRHIDGLMLTGGDDISPEFLRQPVSDPRVIRDPDAARDGWEFSSLAAALPCLTPLFAICRGMQVLNVALGGTLRLDIPNHDNLKFQNAQPLCYAEGLTILIPRVNSSHHQAIDQLGAGLEVEAWCAEDGIIEQVHLRGHPFALGVQYHPERDPLYRPLFDAFVHHVRGRPVQQHF